MPDDMTMREYLSFCHRKGWKPLGFGDWRFRYWLWLLSPRRRAQYRATLRELSG